MTYASELERLPITYGWALNQDITELLEFVRLSTKTPLITVGSGGALTNAVFASVLHQHSGMSAQHFTPLELISSDYYFNDKSVLFITAGGNNPDVVAALSAIIKREPKNLAIICGSKKSRVQQIAEKYNYVKLCSYESPCLRDGFLAVNSVLAFSVLLLRAYSEYNKTQTIPSSFTELLNDSDSPLATAQLEKVINPLLGKKTIFALFGKWGKPAAYDLESKLIESALTGVQINDYRNFAHGRHNWLAKRVSETGLVTLVTKEDQILAKKTLDLIPPDIQVATLQSEKEGPIATIELIAKVLLVTGIFAKYNNTDPARPHIPAFGRKLFHLSVPSSRKELSNFLNALSEFDIAVIERKTELSISKIGQNKTLAEFWVNAYSSFLTNITHTPFEGIICDYDGTLCSFSDRFIGPNKIITEEINEMLDYGIWLGIATGRGDSVRADLRRNIPQRLWSKVVIGYYNGSDVGLLSDNLHPNPNLPTNSQLDSFLSLLKDLPINDLATYKIRPNQITFYPMEAVALTYLFEILNSLISDTLVQGVQILESTHSIDVLSPGVTKLAIVKNVKEALGENEKANVLCIGDKGRSPGNDFALLSTKYSLSVDSVSPNPKCCWNLAPVGFRGVQATEYYLSKLKREKGQIRMKLNH